MSEKGRSGQHIQLRRFDDFELIRPLGSGGMGTVYLAREIALERLVAIKFIATTSADPNARNRLVREAKAIARLQHPNIVSIYRVGSVDGQPYIAYEFVEGRHLDALPRPLEWPKVVHIGLGITRGLAAAHRRGIIHRDLKPANVMLTGTGEVKLLDFGLAKFTDLSIDNELLLEGEPTSVDLQIDAVPSTKTSLGARVTRRLGNVRLSGAAVANRLTDAGALIGTPLYMAPELWENAPASRQTDLYAVGLMLFELLSGSLPHAGLELADLVDFIATDEMPSIAKMLPLLPLPLTGLIDRLVRRDPKERPASVEIVRDELESLANIYLPFTSARSEQPSSDVTCISASFLRASRHGDALGDHFYGRLFVTEPKLRLIFPTDLSSQKRMLIAALKLTVDNLRYPERLVPFLEELGRRHAGYGVAPAYLGFMGQALLETLACMDEKWDDATAQLWSRAYAHIAQIMQRAMEVPQKQTAPPIGPGHRAYWELPLPSQQTEWVKLTDGDIAFQRFGHGGVDIVIVGEWLTHIEQTWEESHLARFLRNLASMGRITLFDRRGCGLSSRRRRATLEKQVDDLQTVMDITGVDRAVLLGIGDGGTAAALFAAMRPERCRALILYGYGRCLNLANGEVAADEEQALESQLSAVRSGWGGPLFLNTLAPSLASDPAYQKWWASYLRNAASPSEAAALLRLGAQASARSVLRTLHTPALVLHREEDRHRSLEDSREAARLIPHAKHLLLPGSDHVPWAGYSDDVLAAIHWFLGNLPMTAHTGSMAACVLGVRALGDTLPAALWKVARSTVAHYRGVSVEEQLEAGGQTADDLLAPIKSASERALDVFEETGPVELPDAPRTLVAYFDGPSRAIRCAVDLMHTAHKLGVSVAMAADAGTLHITPTLCGDVLARALLLLERAEAGKLLLTAALCDLAVGGEFEFLPHPPARIEAEEVALFTLPIKDR